MREAVATGKVYRVEHRIVCPDGNERTVVENAEVQRDSSGQATALLGTVQDITELRLAELALRQSEERLQLAIDGANIGTWHWDLKNETLVWSERTRTIFGFPPEEKLSYKSFLQSVYPQDRPLVESAVRRALEGQYDYEDGFRIIRG